MIYPDEEKITYSYNLGGQLEKVHSYKSYGYDYMSKIGYDKFEQRIYIYIVMESLLKIRMENLLHIKTPTNQELLALIINFSICGINVLL